MQLRVVFWRCMYERETIFCHAFPFCGDFYAFSVPFFWGGGSIDGFVLATGAA